MLNELTLIGRVAEKPEIKTSNAGKSYCRLSVRADRYKDVGEWHGIVFFDKSAEILNKFVDKGDMIYVKAQLSYNKVMNDKGREINTPSLIGRDFKFLGKSQKNAGKNPEPQKIPSNSITTEATTTQVKRAGKTGAGQFY